MSKLRHEDSGMLVVANLHLTFVTSFQLLDAWELSKLTMKTVKQNLWWAFAYNIVSIFIRYDGFFFLFFSSSFENENSNLQAP